MTITLSTLPNVTDGTTDRPPRRTLRPLGMLAALALVSPLAPAATITVNSTADEQIAGNGQCTIKEAFANVNAARSSGAITDVSAGDCVAADAKFDTTYDNTIVLQPEAVYRIGTPMAPTDAQSGLVAFDSPRGRLTVEGRGSVLQIEPGEGQLRGVSAGGSVQHWRELTIRGGRVDTEGGGMAFGSGNLTLEAVTLTGNRAVRGGGLSTASGDSNNTVTLDRSTVSSNEAAGVRAVGGIFWRNADASGYRLVIRNSTISGNRAVGTGLVVGGLRSDARGRMDRVTIENSTVSDNEAIDSSGAGASFGGVALLGFGESTRIRGSVISGNRGGTAADLAAQCGGVASTPNAFSDGYNVLGSDGRFLDPDSLVACNGAAVFTVAPTDLIPPAGTTIEQILAPLADNGGPTQTHALAPRSLALDAIPANVAEHCVPGSTDQRGVARGRDGDGDGVANCDIGAFEADPPLLQLSAGSLRFGAGLLRVGPVRLGRASEPQTVTLRNDGGALLNIASITTTGDFVQDNACGTTLASGTTCTITLRFLPSRAGERSGELRIDSNAPDSPARVALSGRGVGLSLALGGN